MSYTNKYIMDECKKAMIKNPNDFYNYRGVNYAGKTKEGCYYTEVISEFLTSKMETSNEKWWELLKKINEHDRTQIQDSYNANHDGVLHNSNGDEMADEKVDHSKEEIIAIDIFNQCKREGAFVDSIGKILDYQTPLKAEKKDPYGKIDLLSVNENKKKIYILELKKDKSKTKETAETMLRCVLEAYTYYKIVAKKSLLRDFNLVDYEEKDIVIAPLVFANDGQHEEWKEMKKGNRPKLGSLINELDVEVEPFFLELIDEHNHRYKITKWTD